MRPLNSVIRFRAGRRLGKRLLQSAVVALLIVLTLPAGASEERAVKSRVAPTYPEIARRMKVSGEVRLQTTVDASGKVLDVKAVSGNHILAMAAEDAVRRWKFEPGTGNTTVTVSVNFSLGGGD